MHCFGSVASSDRIRVVIAAILAACGDTPTPAATSVSLPSVSASDLLEALPSNVDGYVDLGEMDPAGFESMVEKNIETLSEQIRKDSTNVDPTSSVESPTYPCMYTVALLETKAYLNKLLQDFTKAIDLDPSNAGAYIGRGEAYDFWMQRDRAVQEYDTAVKHLTESIDLDSQDVDAFIERAYAYSGLRESDKLLQDLNSAIELDPGNPQTLIRRSFTHSESGELDVAIRDLDNAIRLDPNSASALQLSRVHLHGGGRVRQGATGL